MIIMNKLWSFINDRDVKSKKSIEATDGMAFGQPTQRSLDDVINQIDWPEDAIFFDLGSGTGTILFDMAVRGERGSKFIGLEFSKELVAESELRKQMLIQHGFFKQMEIVENIHADILKLTDNDLLEYGRNKHIVFFSFDARMPVNVVEHIKELVLNYRGNNGITWISTFSSYKLSINMTELNGYMRIGPAGVTELTDDVILTLSEQFDNYTEQEWSDIERKEEANQLSNMVKTKAYFLKHSHEDKLPMIPILEGFKMYYYQSFSGRKRVKINCSVCDQRNPKSQCGKCGTKYCSKYCQKVDWRKRNHKDSCCL